MATITGPKGLVKAACWYAKYLGIADKEFTLNITRRKLCCANAFASFDVFSMAGEIELDPRKKSVDIYQILAHEMVHIKQYVLGELDETHPSGTVWKGQLFIETGKDQDYWESPWEIEAYGKEKGMNYLRMKDNYK